MTSRSAPVYLDLTNDYVNEDENGFLIERHFSQQQYVGESSVTSDGPVPSYSTKIATGQNATSVLNGTEFVVDRRGASLSFGLKNTNPLYWPVQPLRKITWSGLIFSVPVPDSVFAAQGLIPKADNQARARFYQNLNSVRTAFQGAVTAGELGETLRMIKSPTKRLRNLLSDYLLALKRGAKGRHGFGRESFVRDTWLEYSFGIAPLASDIENAIVAFYKSKWPRPIFKMVRARGRDEIVTPLYDDDQLLDGGNGFAVHFRVDNKIEADIKYYGVYHSTGSGVSRFEYYGFSPREFIPTVYELIPYSFLVDYFTNIGDIISSWSYRTLGVSWAAKGSKVSTRNYTRGEFLKWHPEVVFNPEDYEIYGEYGDPGSLSIEMAVKSRGTVLDVPLPSLELQVPGLSSTKWLNLAALSSQLSSTRRALRSG